MSEKSDAVAKALAAFFEANDVAGYVVAFSVEEGRTYRVISAADPQEMLEMIHGMHVTLYKGMIQHRLEELALFAQPHIGEA